MNEQTVILIVVGSCAFCIALTALLGIVLLTAMWLHRPTSEEDEEVSPYTDLPANFWTPEDAAAWLSFRGTPAGRKLGTILANQVARSAVVATAVQDATAGHACGRACGIRDAVAVLDSLLPEQTLSPAGAQSGTSEAPDQDPGSFEHLRP